MFSSAYKQKLAQASKSLVQNSKRGFQYYGKTYLSGFDRMLVDKLNLVSGLNGKFFALFGLLNLGLYGASFIMTKEQYDYHFSYNGIIPRMFTPFKAMAASDTLANVIWTAPSLIGVNLYMLGKVGNTALTKFFFLSLASNFIFWSAFNPQSGLNFRPLKSLMPINFDAYGANYFRGADSIAQSLIYFALIYNRLWMITFASMAFDVLYYGPSTLGGPVGALVGAAMFL